MILMDESTLHHQEGMETAFRQYFLDIASSCSGTLNAMLDIQTESCNRAEKTVTLISETKPWMANPGGFTHGGITAAYLDIVMGLLCRYFSNGRMTMSIHMDVNYLRAIPIGTKLSLRASIQKTGNSICFAEGRILDRANPETVFATATGTYSVAKG